MTSIVKGMLVSAAIGAGSLLVFPSVASAGGEHCEHDPTLPECQDTTEPTADVGGEGDDNVDPVGGVATGAGGTASRGDSADELAIVLAGGLVLSGACVVARRAALPR